MEKVQYFTAIRSNSILSTLATTLLGSLFIALFAQIELPLPFSPVPVTGHTLAILLLGVTLGSKQAAASTILYLLEGLTILNPIDFFGPSAGYLYAMPVMAYIAGKANVNRSQLQNILILALAATAVLTIGTAFLSFFVGFDYALPMGFYPFIPGEGLKIMAALALIGARKHLG
jgi:biotin transport system substrate-specific component